MYSKNVFDSFRKSLSEDSISFAAVGRAVHESLNGKPNKELDIKRLETCLSTCPTSSYEVVTDDGEIHGWEVSDDTLAAARKELGEWVLHFLTLAPKTHTVHLHWEVCETCNGQGKHVNPSIDAHGISADEFSEDPDFADDYHRGSYDVTCYECGGRTTSVAVDRGRTSEATLKYVNEWFDNEASYRAECDAERRMGA